jgi:hypothetical protein
MRHGQLLIVDDAGVATLVHPDDDEILEPTDAELHECSGDCAYFKPEVENESLWRAPKS